MSSGRADGRRLTRSTAAGAGRRLVRREAGTVLVTRSFSTTVVLWGAS